MSIQAAEVDPAGYVDMLRSRRLEEEASRKKRSERRADFMNRNLSNYRKRETDVRAGMMKAKLRMMSHVERDVFDMLHEQAQWRHVMRENVSNRQLQCKEIETQRQQLQIEHLQHTLREEANAFAVTVRDEEERWEAAKSHAAAEERKAAVKNCQDVLNGIVNLASEVINFVELKQADLATNGQRKLSAFDLMPPTIFSLMKRRACYSDPVELSSRMMEDHISLTAYGVEEALADDPIHGPLFCSLIAKLLTLQFPKPQPLRPSVPTPKTYVVLNGQRFTGKSTTAKALAAKFNLMYVSDKSLIEQVLNELEADVRPQDLESEECCQALSLGKEARQVLQKGGSIGSDLLARLVLHKIKHLPHEFSGILFDDVPSDRATFEKVEAALSGYKQSRLFAFPNPPLAPSSLPQIDINNPLFIVEKPEAPPPPPDEGKEKGKEKKPEPKGAAKKDKKKEEPEEPLPPIDLPAVDPIPPLTEEEEQVLANANHDENISGIHRVIHVDCSSEEIFRRFAGIRLDVETNHEYHVHNHPPSLERMPFIAACDRVDGDATRLHDALEKQKQKWAELQKWSATYAGLICEVDGNAPLPTVEEKIEEVVQATLVTAVQEFEAYEAAENLQKERKEMEALFAERSATRESIRKQLAQVYTERGVELPSELQEPPKKQSENRELVMHPNTPATCLGMLDDFTDYYRSSVYEITSELGSALSTVFDNGVWCSAQYESFWKQPDTKQRLVDGFVAELNAMPQALRRDVQGKEELHLRSETLHEQLCAGVDKRKDDATALIETSLNPTTFLESWGDTIRLLGSGLVQLEVERFVMTKNVCASYYGGVKLDPYQPEEAEFLQDLLLLPKAAEKEEVVAPAKGAKDAKKAPPPKGKVPEKAAEKGKETIPGEEHPPEDLVSPLIEKAIGVAKGVIEKLQTPTQPIVAAPTKGGKAPKAPVDPIPTAPEVPSTGTLVLPIMNAEFELTKKRLTAIGDFIRQLVELGNDRAAGQKKKLLHKLRNQIAAEMSAVNGCLFHMRSCIEEETPVHHYISIEGAEFAIDYGLPLMPVQQPTHPAVTTAVGRTSTPDSSIALLQHQRILSCLTMDRMIRIVELLKAIAPKYIIHCEDFCRIVKSADWQIFPDVEPPSPEEIFLRFDLIDCGAIDWREFVIHLLFWVEPLVKPGSSDTMEQGAKFHPSGIQEVLSLQGFETAESPFTGSDTFASQIVDKNKYFVEGPNLVQLFDMRSFMGGELMDYHTFLQNEMYFETQMEQTRCNNYKDILWETFAIDGMLDPNTFAMFLCADEQPLRGVQKAFAMGAPVGDEACALTSEMLHKVFHFSACNYQDFGMEDMYSLEDLESLFAPPIGNGETITFQEVCQTGFGRLLLNNTNIFRKRKFT